MGQLSFTGYGASLDEKVERAVALLRLYEPNAMRLDPENGYWLGFSGGKDSVVVKELARMAGVKYRVRYSVTTIDPPELVRFIREHHPDVEWIVSKRSFFQSLIQSNGPPTRLVRWCCEEFKEGGGEGKVKLLGIRTAESVKRSKNWKEVTLWRSKLGGFVVAPIVYWSDSDVWQFIRSRKLPYCSLYDEGFKRLGCVGCPMAGQQRKRDFARWPKMEKAWQHAFRLYFEARKGRPLRNGEPRYLERFRTWRDYWDWWMSDKPSSAEETDCLGLFDEDGTE